MKNILLILFLLLLGPCLIAQEYITINDKPYRIDTLIYKHRVGPGTEYVYVDLPEFPLKIHVLEIDLKNPKTNRKNAGFTDEEKRCFGIFAAEAGKNEYLVSDWNEIIS